MWARIAIFIIKYRLALIVLLSALTVFMAWKAKDVQMTYDLVKVVSEEDEDLIYYKRFKKRFGEDSNVLVLGMQDSAVYELNNFRHLKTLNDSMARVPGVKGVLSLPKLIRISKDTAARAFVPELIFKTLPQTQAELDSLLRQVHNIKFYQGQIVNQQTGATLMALTIDSLHLNSNKRQEVLASVLKHGANFTRLTGIKLHYAGLPYVRATMTNEVAGEMKFFLMLSLLVTTATLLFLFRSMYAVIFPVLVIIAVVIWGLAFQVMMGYKITLLTGLIPTIIVVIGIPNCTYLISRYHYDYRQHRNKIRALTRIVRKIGLVTLMNNTTTAVGFFVFYLTDVAILKEFGLVATANIFAAFLISIILIPAIFSYLPPPSDRQLRHLDAKPLNKLLEFFDFIVHNRRPAIYVITGIIMTLGILGIMKIKTVSYMVDDLPEESSVNRDLAFFEQHFNGVMPLEIEVNTGRPRGVMKLSSLKKIDQLENYLRTQPIMSPPLSIAGFVKAATQAFYNEDPASFRLPDKSEAPFILSYLRKQKDNTGLLKSFVDTTGQRARISLKVADIGSRQIDTLLNRKLVPQLNRIYGGEGITTSRSGNTFTFVNQESKDTTQVSLTGTTLLFLKGNDYLISNLRSSLLLAFALVSLIIGWLFKSVRLILISIIPNVIPLIITGGLMGFFKIPLKPSTALIFSIALGLAVDNAIHFLAKYRQELLSNGYNVSAAISTTIREAGTSMIYTSAVLFFGFVIFAWSDFGGTVALGLLTSITLMIAVFTNLIFLPATLMSFDSGRFSREDHPLIEDYNEFYLETEDEDLNLDLLELEKREDQRKAGNTT